MIYRVTNYFRNLPIDVVPIVGSLHFTSALRTGQLLALPA